MNIKSYTDLEQSKKLAKFLPLESADMWYQHTGFSIKDGSEKPIYFPMIIRDCESDKDIPCWSLSALISVLPNTKLCHYNETYFGQYMGRGMSFQHIAQWNIIIQLMLATK